MTEEIKPTPQTSSEKASPQEPAAKKAKAKKAKPPKLEDKPFNEFVEQHFHPSLQEALISEGLEDIKVKFVKQKIAIQGFDSNQECWQIVGNWLNQSRQFNLYFLEEDITGQKAFSCATDGNESSTLESFMIDEKRITLDLLVLYIIQRLNSQKWLFGN